MIYTCLCLCLLLVQAVLCAGRTSFLRTLQFYIPASAEDLELNTADDYCAGTTYSLEAYCVQRSGKNWNEASAADYGYVIGQPVTAHWLGFGVWYKAHIASVNTDATGITYNIVFCDGMMERKVKPSNVRPRRDGPKGVDTQKDPACKLNDFVKDLNKNVDESVEEAAGWLSEKREHIAGSEEQNGDNLLKVMERGKAVEQDLDHIEAKTKELEKEGKMDPELESVIDDVLKKGKQMKDKTKAMVNAVVKTFASNDAASAKNVTDAVKELEYGLRDVKTSASGFDTFVTPNKRKWWRWRHEYSFVEAGIMLCIVPLMVLYKYIFTLFYDRHSEAYSNMWFAALLSDVKTLFSHWLECAAAEAFLSLCVALTVWLVATFGGLDFLVFYIHDDKMYLPTTADQYRIMAVNLSMQLCLSLIVYQSLMCATISASVWKIKKWRDYDEKWMVGESSLHHQRGTHHLRASASSTSSHGMMELIQTGVTLTANSKYPQLRQYFMESLDKHPQIKSKIEEIHPLSKSFPFADYLAVNVRLYLDGMVEISYKTWAAIWVTYVVFMLLHRFAEMTYVRIMTFFAVLLAVALLGMVHVLHDTSRRMKEWNMKDEDEKADEIERAIAWAKRIDVEQLLSHLLQFTLWFLCYGFVRMVTAPWLWHIYFYNVLLLTCVYLLGIVLFALNLAPLVPSFYAAMSIPPHINERDAEIIVHAMKHRKEFAYCIANAETTNGKSGTPASEK